MEKIKPDNSDGGFFCWLSAEGSLTGIELVLLTKTCRPKNRQVPHNSVRLKMVDPATIPTPVKTFS